MATVLITGGTGLVGQRLANLLHSQGFDVVILSRKKTTNSKFRFITWDEIKNFKPLKELGNLKYIIHLSGANVSEKRWIKDRKKLLYDSRIGKTNLLFDYSRRLNIKLHAFISASAIGYYGSLTSEKVFAESDNPGNDFLAELCVKWEQSADRFSDLGSKVVKIRTGVVLSRNGGFLEKITNTFRYRFAAILGNGNQYIPWIHIDDLCGIYLKALQDDNINGAFNASAPSHTTNKQLTEMLVVSAGKKIITLKTPSFVIKMAFGEMSSMLLNGSRVSSDKIIKSGYEFKYTDLKSAVNKI